MRHLYHTVHECTIYTAAAPAATSGVAGALLVLASQMTRMSSPESVSRVTNASATACSALARPESSRCTRSFAPCRMAATCAAGFSGVKHGRAARERGTVHRPEAETCLLELTWWSVCVIRALKLLRGASVAHVNTERGKGRLKVGPSTCPAC